MSNLANSGIINERGFQNYMLSTIGSVDLRKNPNIEMPPEEDPHPDSPDPDPQPLPPDVGPQPPIIPPPDSSNQPDPDDLPIGDPPPKEPTRLV